VPLAAFVVERGLKPSQQDSWQERSRNAAAVSRARERAGNEAAIRVDGDR